MAEELATGAWGLPANRTPGSHDGRPRPSVAPPVDLGGVGALYVHVPFCRRRCAYCDFATAAVAPDDPLVDAYVAATVSLLEALRGGMAPDSVRTAYVGGGTPSFLGAARVGRLVAAIVACAPQLVELSVEANPDSLGGGLARSLSAAGATRVSVGVQSLVDEELVALGRVHDARTAREALASARDAGLAVSADLMCAIPLQTGSSLAFSIEGVLDGGATHVSVYPLSLEEGTPLARQADATGGDAPWNDPDLAADRMEIAAELLGSHGLSRYEVASYARPGASCRHNVAYWTGVPYVGVGTAAASMLDARTYDRLRRRLARQLPARPDGVARCRLVVASSSREIAQAPRWDALRFDVEFMGERQAVAEDLMLGMRMTRGVGPALVSRARSLMGARLDETIGHVVDRGLARWSGERLVPTRDGWLLGNLLYGAFWGLAGDRTGEMRAEPL